MKFILCISLCILCIKGSGADLYVAPGASGDGLSITNPMGLQAALTGTGSPAAGDTIWLRGGTYFPPNRTTTLGGTNVPAEGGFGWTITIAGVVGNPITIRSYSGEVAKVDRPLRFGSYGNLHFRDLEFYDSLKGFQPGLDYIPDFPWNHFDDSGSPGNEWINCIVHDVNNCWAGNSSGKLVRGCITWYVGNDIRDHTVYPNITNYIGNISAWVAGMTLQAVTSTGLTANSNIAWGAGLTWGSVSSSEFYLSYPSTLRGNIVFEQSIYTSPVYDLGGSTLIGNIFASRAPASLAGGNSLTYSNNSAFMRVDGAAFPVLIRSGSSAGTWTVNSNSYFSLDAVLFNNTNNTRTFPQWKSDYPGFDTVSISSDSTEPPDSVTVYPNVDEPKRAHIAIFNWSGADNVNVSLAGVLNTGDAYRLISAQNYLAGAIRYGIYDGTSISVPMTNLNNAPLLYTTAVWGLTQPAVTSPDFGAFVLVGGETEAVGMATATTANVGSTMLGTP